MLVTVAVTSIYNSAFQTVHAQNSRVWQAGMVGSNTNYFLEDITLLDKYVPIQGKLSDAQLGG